MSLRAISWAMGQDAGGHFRKLVLILLADCHNESTDRCDPSVSLIARRAEASERGVRYALEELCEAGLLVRHKRSGRSTQYALNMNGTPAPRAPLHEVHPGTTCRGPRHHVQGTPAPRAGDPGTTCTLTGKNRKEPERTNKGARETFAPNLDKTAWSRWLDYRKQIGKPLKPVSHPAAQKKLAAFGADQAAVVEQSVANGYQGLFPLKTDQARASPKADRYTGLDEKDYGETDTGRLG